MATQAPDADPRPNEVDHGIDINQLLRVLQAARRGDFSARMPADQTGMGGKINDTLNEMIEQNQLLVAELSRITRLVGKEGKTSQRAALDGSQGGWRNAVDAVNELVADLVAPTTDVARVIAAVARGDLSQSVATEMEGRPLRGDFLRTARSVNGMVDQLNSFVSEVTRVAREVGTEGTLGGQAKVKGVAGVWKDLTDSVNMMAGNLTAQVRNIAEVTTAVANGDLSRKMTVDVKGEILELKITFNTMVDQLNSFASEVTRVAREVGDEGKLGGQAQVKGVAGTWKDLTDSVNMMAGNLTAQVRNIAEVTTAVANGDLSRKMTVEVRGEILELKNTMNTMVDQLNSFASEVTRVAREVGTEGKLGAQADVKGVAGTWKDLTDSVNVMASNLTTQVRSIAVVTTAVAMGDLSKKITVDVKGEILELKDMINTMVDQLNSFASEVTRVAREVGAEGKLGGQAQVKGVAGTWKDLTDSVNMMAGNLTSQVRNIAAVTTAVANGDLSKKITVDVQGEFLELNNTVNTFVDQLSSFASEVTRVAKEVGTDGILGGQADVKGVGGVWKALTDNVNSMASNLTNQVRGIARVVTAVATGDLKKKLLVEAKGEIAALADTINGMTDTLATFADQVTTVAREVGIEGKLGGQARVPGAAGTWRDLTDNVNQLAANLTIQVRAISEVATAVTKGDLTRTISVEAQGEVASLKDYLNEMIRNLRETTLKNTQQDWLKTNLARFTRILQGQRDLLAVAKLILSELAPLVKAQIGTFFLADVAANAEVVLKLVGTYAYNDRKSLSHEFRLGQGLVGQCALEKQRILVAEAPANYVKISSSLGEAAPVNIVALPVLFEGQLKAVLELGSFHDFSEIHIAFLDQLTESIGIVLNTIVTNVRTEDLLKQSQSLTQELQVQQEELKETNVRLEKQAATLRDSEERLKQQQHELQQTNEELEEKARLLFEQKKEVETKNREIDLARRSLEEKAQQLALTSKYKSEFLANMSHELRTPLNSLLILSDLLATNAEANLTEKQVEFAHTIHDAGADLLSLINEILDLSKIESGTVSIDVEEVRLDAVRDDTELAFRHVAENKGLAFDIELSPRLPAVMTTDRKRLQQVLKNLLSNAFKFTEHGSVVMRMEVAESGWAADSMLVSAAQVLAFTVADTGIGIPADKQRIIFEAFQQADGTTSRKYGGTGLGLSISREIVRLLGGELSLTSELGKGSTFKLFLPRDYTAPTNPGADGSSGDFSVRTPALSRSGPALQHGEMPVIEAERDEAVAADAAQLAEELETHVSDDRKIITGHDRTLLIVDDDLGFARLMLDMARERGFKAIVATRGDTALALARKYKPDAITLDVHLPMMDGWQVLDRLKHDPVTRHIPVHMMSIDDQKMRGLEVGAFAWMQKPVTKETLAQAFNDLTAFVDRRVKNLLVVEDDERERNAIKELIGNGDVKVQTAGTGEAALELMRRERFDCMVLDLGLPDIPGIQLIERVRAEAQNRDVPIIVYTGRDLTRQEETELRKVAEGIIIKNVKSPERLLDETALFLHRVEANLPEPKRKILEKLHQQDPQLAGRLILIVDDDVRNIFALASALERQQMKVVYAEDGQTGIEMLKSTPGIDIVLMDVMMPQMDGYETMRQIRAQEAFANLPIIALTAKAMKSDRGKCIEAGASDYITKPVDLQQLLSLMRVWLHR